MSDRAMVEAVGTFMGVPAARDLSASRAAVLGIPFDCGFHPTPIGARLGPNSIREHSALVRRYEPPLRDFDPVARASASSIMAMSKSVRAMSPRRSKTSRRR
jgi:arginase family enzyme